MFLFTFINLANIIFSLNRWISNLKKGDKVVAGQLIGTVASPSAYYIEEGPGVYFKLTQYGEPINPDTYFVK